MVSIEKSDIRRLSLEAHVLSAAAHALDLDNPLPELLDTLLANVCQIWESVDFAAVMIWDQTSGLFRPLASYGCDRNLFKRIGLRAGESITGRTYDEDRPHILATQAEVAAVMGNMRPANRATLARALGTEDTANSTLAVPIRTAQQKFGVLVFESFHLQNPLTLDDLPVSQHLAKMIGLLIDRSRLEAKADAIRQTREAERLRSEVMATLSHEMRMPLTTIRGYTTMLLMDEIEWTQAKVSEYLQLIDEECESMNAMIKNILDSSLMDVNQISMEPQPLRLLHIAREVANETTRRTTNHQIIVEFSNDTPLVNADVRWLKQVFRNILDNAVKYSPNGGLIVIRSETRANDVVISIADQGIGISPEDLIPLFEKFFRVKSSDVRGIPGTGLGLPIARAIVEMHGGRIWADSKLGQGTTVHFTLPIYKPQTGELKPVHESLRNGDTP